MTQETLCSPILLVLRNVVSGSLILVNHSCDLNFVKISALLIEVCVRKSVKALPQFKSNFEHVCNLQSSVWCLSTARNLLKEILH